MSILKVTLLPGPYMTRLLATHEDDDCLRAMLPTHPVHPRAPHDLLEALASWLGTPADAAIAVDARGRGGFEESLFGGGLLPDNTARVRYRFVSDRRPYRLRGVSDFRPLYRVHWRSL